MSEGITADQLAPGTVTVFSQSVTLTDAQIKALPVTSVMVLEAEPDKAIIVVGGLALLDNTAGVYGDVDAAAQFFLSAAPPASGNRSGTIDLGWALTDGSAPVVALIVPPVFSPGDNIAGYSNSDYLNQFAGAGLAIGAVNGAMVPFSLGNAANTLKVTVLYTIIDV